MSPPIAAMFAEIDKLRAEVARLGAELRQARFVASGEFPGTAERIIRRNGRLLAALREISEMASGTPVDAAVSVARKALRVGGERGPEPESG